MCNSALGLQMHLRLNYLSIYLKSKDVSTAQQSFSCAYIISCKNANDMQTKTLKYLPRNNTRNCGKNEKKCSGEKNNIKSESI